MKYTETHQRSVAKTITVRVLFTLSHFINGFIVTGTWALTAQIAGLATLINMFLFWAHERIWNWVQWNRKPKDNLMFFEGQPRTISKSVTWRLLITTSNFVIPYLITGSWGSAVLYAGIATILNAAIYYGHERAWNRVSWGKTEKQDKAVDFQI